MSEESIKIFDEESLQEKNPQLDNAPNPLSEEWSDYVLSIFSENELDEEGRPLVAGLRRVAEMIIGKIVSSGPVQVFPSTEINNMGRATVVFGVQFENGLSYSEVADCWFGNTDEFVAAYPVATASTRAEARALRKALKLRVVGADEVTKKKTSDFIQPKKETTDGESKENELCTERQMGFLSDLCERTSKITKEELIKEICGELKSENQITKNQASKMISRINDIIRIEKENE